MKPQMAREAGFILRADKDVIGKKLVNAEGQEIGKIEELAIDPRTGAVTYAIVSFGGFLGMGDKLFAVPWVSMTCDTGRDRFIIDANKELLENAPGFDQDDWPDLSDPNRALRLRAYYSSSAGGSTEIYSQAGTLSAQEQRRGPEAPGALLDDWGKGDKH